MIGNNVTSKVLSSRAVRLAGRASIRPEWTPAAVHELEQAVEDFDIATSAAWPSLDELSNSTIVDGIFLFPESTMFQNGHFIVPATVGVTLNYGGNSELDRLKVTDSFPANIEFEIENVGDRPKVSILNVLVDTASFYK